MPLQTRQTFGRVFCFAALFLTAWSSSAEQKDKLPELLKIFDQEFVSITPGEGKFPKSFQMGSTEGPAEEGPVRKVTFSDSFAIAKYEVPQNLYLAVMGNNPSKWQGEVIAGEWTGRRNSVEQMTFADAQQFCSSATQLMRDNKLIKEDEEIRLPSEAEWEYCCRAGTTTKYSFGDEAVKPGDEGNQATILSDYAWHTGNAAGNDPPVGAKKPNAWGLYDMHGYLWEFVADAWHDNYKDAPSNGAAWSSDDAQAARVLRSGSWKDSYSKLTSTARREIKPDEVGDEIGIRCVKAKVKKAP